MAVFVRVNLKYHSFNSVSISRLSSSEINIDTIELLAVYVPGIMVNRVSFSPHVIPDSIV
jgi:hypothetical protein